MSQADIYFHSHREREEFVPELLGMAENKWGASTNPLKYKITVETKEGEVDLDLRFNQDEWCENDAEIKFPHDWNRFKYMIDFYGEDDHPEDHFNQLVEDILVFFWEQGVPAVAVGYEDEGILHQAGINSTEVPWPNDQGIVGEKDTA